MSLLEFKAIQYRPKGNAVANDEQRARIARVPKREFIRRGINQHTLEKICQRDPGPRNQARELLESAGRILEQQTGKPEA